MAIEVNKLYNANVYVDGNSYLGRTEEFELPKIIPMMVEHKALGMVGKIELPSGWDKMDATLKWNSFYPDAMRKAANPYQSVQMQLRGSLETWTSGGRTAQQRYVVFMTVQFKDFPTGAFKQQENAEFESPLNVLYIRVEVGGQPIVEFDPLANIYKVDGVDVLEQYRANLGI
jgi:P2 family phage contractile tail tube protein